MFPFFLLFRRDESNFDLIFEKGLDFTRAKHISAKSSFNDVLEVYCFILTFFLMMRIENSSSISPFLFSLEA